tara:strand:+ start:956 stop:1771 length:816 start_codon:yes stop_codon:yes gene_type:complete
MLNLKNKKNIMGMIHLLPTIGFEGYVSIEEILKRALEDLRILEEAKVDAIIIENNYDLPHKIKINSETLVLMGQIISEIKKRTKIPLGVNVLWNDYKASISLAKIHGCDFVRIPVFVDYVKTSFGEVKGEAKKVLEYRKKIGAENVKLLVDIQVKHAELLNKRPISDAAIEAIEKGADGLIVTGDWTGEAPLIDELKEIKKVAEDTPVIVGSGADKSNINELFQFSDAAIISTSLKEGESKSPEEERNLKGYDAKIDSARVREFMGVVNDD